MTTRGDAIVAGAGAIHGEAAHYCGPGYGTCGEVIVGKDYAADLAALVVDAVEPIIRADLRAKVKALPVAVVDLDPDPHGRPIERRAVLLSDVLALLPEEKP